MVRQGSAKPSFGGSNPPVASRLRVFSLKRPSSFQKTEGTWSLFCLTPKGHQIPMRREGLRVCRHEPKTPEGTPGHRKESAGSLSFENTQSIGNLWELPVNPAKARQPGPCMGAPPAVVTGCSDDSQLRRVIRSVLPQVTSPTQREVLAKCLCAVGKTI